MKQQRKLVQIGMDEGDAFAALLRNGWLHTGSDEGWFRVTHWAKPWSMTVEYDSNGTVTAVRID